MIPRAARPVALAALAAAAIGVPALATSGEESDRFIPATEAEQRELVESLQPVVECARRLGAEVPDPVAVPTGAIIPWPGDRPDPKAERAMRRCEDFHVP
jgi:sugar phosphate isomerase/epimerase